MDVILPKWGMTMQEATIVRWLRADGDVVAEGDPLVDVETDKVDVAVVAPIAGVLTQRLVEPGDVVPVGATLGVIDAA